MFLLKNVDFIIKQHADQQEQDYMQANPAMAQHMAQYEAALQQHIADPGDGGSPD